LFAFVKRVKCFVPMMPVVVLVFLLAMCGAVAIVSEGGAARVIAWFWGFARHVALLVLDL